MMVVKTTTTAAEAPVQEPPQPVILAGVLRDSVLLCRAQWCQLQRAPRSKWLKILRLFSNRRYPRISGLCAIRLSGPPCFVSAVAPLFPARHGAAADVAQLRSRPR